MDALELTVDPGRPASAGRFFSMGADLLALLDELTDLPVAWRVEDLRTGSAVVLLAPPEDGPAEARHLRVVVDSLGAVQGGGPLPDDWTPDAVKAAHRFVEDGQAAENEADWAPPRLRLVRDGHGGPAVDLTPPTLLEGLATLQPFERDMPGAVRGTLVGFNVSRGNRASLRLPTRRVVRVGFPSGLRERMRDSLLQDVELRGTVRQDGERRVFKVVADEVEVLAEPSVRWADMFGAAPDSPWTSGWRPTVARPEKIERALLDASALLGVVTGDPHFACLVPLLEAVDAGQIRLVESTAILVEVRPNHGRDDERNARVRADLLALLQSRKTDLIDVNTVVARKAGNWPRT